MIKLYYVALSGIKNVWLSLKIEDLIVVGSNIKL